MRQKSSVFFGVLTSARLFRLWDAAGSRAGSRPAASWRCRKLRCLDNASAGGGEDRDKIPSMVQP